MTNWCCLFFYERLLQTLTQKNCMSTIHTTRKENKGLRMAQCERKLKR